MMSDGHGSMGLPAFNPEHPYRAGEDPIMDAWYTTFFIENHLDYSAYPDCVASPEQVRFMVYAEENERYYPCSDRMFGSIMRREKSRCLQEKYEDVLHRILDLIDRQIENEWDKTFLRCLFKSKYQHETRDGLMIPSRLEKRLLKLYLDRTQIDDPYLCEKAGRNKQAFRMLSSEAFQKALNHIDEGDLLSFPAMLSEIKGCVDCLKLQRLFALSVEDSLWESDVVLQYTVEDFLMLLGRSLAGDGVEPLWDFLLVHRKQGASGMPHPKKILWLVDEAGGVMVDLAIIRYLTQLGHKVIISFKRGPLFTKVDFYDAQEDEILCRELEDVLLMKEQRLGKNELVHILKSDKNIMAICDGTREDLNLLLASTTFARVFKEVDCIISKGPDQRRRFFDTHFRFTQDIYSIAKDENGVASIWYKARHPAVIKFSHKDLEKKAQAIISQMEAAKQKGMTVIFYSGIIGSIPGRLAMAKRIMSIFIRFLKEQSANTFIINPSEYYEAGMDADDLMFMWEIVQRSCLIDIWRFQLYDDIIKAFEIMGTKVPPEWAMAFT